MLLQGRYDRFWTMNLTKNGRALGDDPRLSPPLDAALGLYAHVPFCTHKCHYCDFYSLVDQHDRIGQFSDRLLEELEQIPAGTAFDTIFFGGGTPTMLPQNFWESWSGILSRRFVLPSDYEWTVEANPETITADMAHALVSAGVNRMSLGVQSFTTGSLQTLERRHQPESVPRAVELLREAGISRLSLDLIFGVPGQDLDGVAYDISEALALKPDHLSVYGLIFEPNTALTKRRDLGMVEPCDEEFEAEAYELVVSRLQSVGLHRYEVSNFALPGEQCRHNLKYWKNKPWWALGPSSSGQFSGARWKNQRRLDGYLSSTGWCPLESVEIRTEELHRAERFLLGLRLQEGLSIDELESLQAGPGSPRAAVIRRMVDRGLLHRGSERLSLTDQGFLLADQVIGELM